MFQNKIIKPLENEYYEAYNPISKASRIFKIGVVLMELYHSVLKYAWGTDILALTRIER